MLSQFAGEREVLFPPFTLLEVLGEQGGEEEAMSWTARARSPGPTERFATEEAGKTFVSIDVLPTFV